MRSFSCVSIHMFRLIHRAIFRLVFRMVCMYSCWCFESYEISVSQIVIKISVVKREKFTARHQQEIFQPTRKAILLLCLIPTLALGLTQPLTEMSTRNVSWGVKAASA